MSTLMERQLRASVAMPMLIDACKRALPLLSQQYDAVFHAAEMMSVQGFANQAAHLHAQADRLLEAIIVAECALKTAEPPLVRVVQEPGLQLVQR